MKNDKSSNYQGLGARLHQACGGGTIQNVLEFLQLRAGLDLDYDTVRFYLTNKRDPKLEVLRKVAKSANCSLDWLIAGESPPTSVAVTSAYVPDDPTLLGRMLQQVIRKEIERALAGSIPHALSPQEILLSEGWPIPADYAQVANWPQLSRFEQDSKLRQLREQALADGFERRQRARVMT